jgi:hypothetical protein
MILSISAPSNVRFREVSALVRSAARVHRIPCPTSVTIAIRPSSGRDGGGYRSDLGQERTGIFLQPGLDRSIAGQPVGQISHDLCSLRRMNFSLQRSASNEAFDCHRHSGAMPTGPREARPDDRLRIEPGISRFRVQPCGLPRNDGCYVEDGRGRTSALVRVAMPSAQLRTEILLRVRGPVQPFAPEKPAWHELGHAAS